MADISKITVGSTTYNVKDTGAVRYRSQASAPYVSYNDLGSYYNAGSTATYIRVKLPVVTSWCMMTMEFTIRQSYSAGYAGKLFIYGNYSSGQEWNQFVGWSSGTLTSDIKVYGSGKQYIYIKGVASWGGLTLDKMTIGDSASSSDLSGIVIDGVSSLPSTYQTATMHYNESYSVAWGNVTGKPSFATVATSGSYNDLSNKPTIPAAQVQTDWNATSGMGVLLNKPSSLPASDVYAWAKASSKPTYTYSEVGAAASNHSHTLSFGDAGTHSTDYALTANTRYELKSGGSSVIIQTPPDTNTWRPQPNWNSTSGDSAILNRPNLATVATSGSYNDLSNKPTIPAAQVQTDWNATSGMGVLLNKPSSLPASDVYSWAKQSTKPSYAFNEISAGNATIGDGGKRLVLRSNATWASGVYHDTAGAEAVVFMNNAKNVNGTTGYSTSWIFAYGTLANQPAWTGLTPAVQIKESSLIINKLVNGSTAPSYNLDVNGTANATTIYENGTALSSKYQAAGSYVPTTRTVNGKALSSNISLTAADVGAATTDTKNTVGNTLKRDTFYLVGVTSTSSTAGSSAQSYTYDGRASITGGTLYIEDLNVDGSGYFDGSLECTGNLDVGGTIKQNGTAVSLAGHTHNYAGSSSAGGAATSANKLNTNAGSATNPVYFSGGVPVACTYSLNKTVPSDAKFTDTVTTATTTGSGNAVTAISASNGALTVTKGSTFSTSGHTHATSIATTSDGNQITLAASTKYKLTAGGTSYVFTTPPSGGGGGSLNLQLVASYTGHSSSNTSSTITFNTTVSPSYLYLIVPMLHLYSDASYDVDYYKVNANIMLEPGGGSVGYQTWNTIIGPRSKVLEADYEDHQVHPLSSYTDGWLYMSDPFQDDNAGDTQLKGRVQITRNSYSSNLELSRLWWTLNIYRICTFDAASFPMD